MAFRADERRGVALWELRWRRCDGDDILAAMISPGGVEVFVEGTEELKRLGASGTISKS